MAMAVRQRVCLLKIPIGYSSQSSIFRSSLHGERNIRQAFRESGNFALHPLVVDLGKLTIRLDLVEEGVDGLVPVLFTRTGAGAVVKRRQVELRLVFAVGSLIEAVAIKLVATDNLDSPEISA